MIEELNVLIEGLSDEIIVKKIIEFVGIPLGPIYGKKGKSYLLNRLPTYNKAAQFSHWLALVDLDQDAACAATFVQNTLPEPSEKMCFRIAVHAIEGWLLADSEHLAAFLGISRTLIPRNPDQEQDPKVTLLNLARRSNRNSLKQDILPRPNTSAKVGKLYVSRIIEFVTTAEKPWRVGVALQHSESLFRCIEALKKIKI